jgi:S1-C subfamily serine protease
MGTLRVATEELHATASGWGTMAGRLTATAPTVPGVPFQPSAAVVTAMHAGVTAASGVLTARTVITAVKATAAATAYTQQEAASADLLNALGEAL